MSEYWKSTPKYWCKFCSAFVRDSPVSRQQHEATPRHKGQVMRSIRNIQLDQEREQRQQQYAKREVARLNGIVSGSPVKSTQTAPRKEVASAPTSKVGPEERKRQLAQLAALGVAVPDDYRKEVAMVGDWQSVEPGLHVEEDKDVRKESMSFGVRKRKYDDAEGREEAQPQNNRTGWGTTFRSYSDVRASTEDIESLMAVGGSTHVHASGNTGPILKQEESLEEKPTVEQEDAVPVVFRKRKNLSKIVSNG